MPAEGLHRLAILVAVAALYAVMLDFCEDRPSCVVKASSETFTQDPCFGTYKYLETHYKCRPNEFERQTVCEGEELQISCGRGDRIAVHSAMFGRAPNGTDKCKANKQGYIDCQSTGALSEVSTQCQGRRSCAILANESVFGDPCVSGVNKYLTVSYACVPQKVLKRLHRKVNNKRKKKKKKKKGNSDDKSLANVTTETEESDALSTTPVGHNIVQASTTQTYEGREQMSGGNTLPETVTDSPLKNRNIHSLEKDSIDQKDTTTSHQSEVRLPGGNIRNSATETPELTSRFQPTYNTRAHIDNNGNDARAIYTNDFTESFASKNNLSKSNKDMNAEYNTHGSNDQKNNDYHSLGNSNTNKESNSIRNLGNTASNKLSNSSRSGNRHKNSKDNVGKTRESNYGANSTHNPLSMDTASINKVKDHVSRTSIYHVQTPNPNSADEKNVLKSPYVTERNLTVLCLNYTRPGVKWGSIVRPKDERTIGFLRDWFSAMYFLQMNQEKAWLYFTLGICFGLIVMLIVVLVKICINFRRNIRARLDVSEPTHRSTHTNNHSSLDAPMIEHSDSMDRIEVVRFSPRNTLRSHRSNSHHRDLVNYYG